MTGHPQSREVVAALLWPEFDIDRSRAALRRTLSTLRTALGGRWLDADRSSIALDLDGGWFDLAEFRRAAADPTAGAATLAARGRPAPRRPARRVLDPLERRVRRLARSSPPRASAASGRRRSTGWSTRWWRPAAATRPSRRAEQRLALDPLHEPAHRRLISCYAASGRRGDALRQYRECVRVLDRELGVRPLAETTELYNAVNEGRSPAVAEAPAAVAGPGPAAGRPRRLVAAR